VALIGTLTERLAPVPRDVLLLQGEFGVSDDPNVVFSTLLGSCVATCIHDPVARVGGMNHFLLAVDPKSGTSSERFGLYAMEVLINGLLQLGARKSRLEAKLFGGATLEVRMRHIGLDNARFALSFLAHEGLPCRAHSLGGRQGRRLRYFPTTGIVSQRLVDDVPVQDTPSTARSTPAFTADDILFFED